MSASPEQTLRVFFSNEKGLLPGFIHGIDDFVHVKIIYLKGRLDGSASTAMDYFYKKAQKNPGQLNKDVLLDFRKVDEVDSATVAQLLKILTLLKKNSHRLGLFNVSQRIVHQLEICNLDQVFQVFASKGEALNEVMRWSQKWE